MENEINVNTQETNDGVSINTNKPITSSIGRDVGMNITDLLKANKEAKKEEEKSPLQMMKEAQEKNGLGMVVENSELQKANEQKTLVKNKSEQDAMDEIDAYNADMDKLIDAAKNSTIVNMPKNPQEMVSMMDTLDAISKGETVTQTAGEKTMIREKTEEEKVANPDTIATVDTESDEQEEEKIDEEKQKIVNILIDKTGLGGNFDFTEEEKEKIFSATEIRVKEVEEVDLASITVKKAEKSFIDSVNEFQISSSKVPVVFPASRFRAYMTGLSYGEMADISLNNENITFDQIQKKLTVIYNKMVNPSIGKFESYEDFLRKFAYVDIDLAVYGLVVATFPEVDDIPLTCNAKSCNKEFNHKYSPRTLIRFEKSDNKFLTAMKSVIECSEADFEKLVEESPTRTHKRYKLPNSGFIIEVGVASSYDYLYTIVDNMLGDKFTEEHPDDVNGILQLNSALLGLVRTVYVPDGEGSYVMYDKFEDMIQALYMIKPDEIAILSSLLQKYTDAYNVTFELTDIVCPHCGRKTKRIPIDINYLVFLRYQRLMSTELNINNISVL